MAVRKPATQDETYGTVRYLVAGTDQLDLATSRIINLGDPTGAQDAATKAYVDAFVNGLDFKGSVRLATAAALAAVTAAGSGVGKTLTADANGALSVDGVAVAVGNRLLIKDQAAGADNGIYVVTDAGSAGTPFILTRATDYDQNAEVTAGTYVISTEGTANGDKAWLLTTNDPITVDTTALVFSAFPQAVSYTGAEGILLTGAAFSVELDTAANAQGAGSAGGSSGLEFDTTGAAAKLRAAVHATGGLERTATGLAAKLNGATLVSGASGLSVASAPILRAPYVSAEALTAGHPVTWSTTNDQAYQARANDDARSFAFGVCMTTVGASGAAIDVITHGVAAGVLTGATAGAHYFVASAGGLTATLPSGGDRRRMVGWAVNATDLFVHCEDRGKSAA
jgi:hypothetical protein